MKKVTLIIAVALTALSLASAASGRTSSYHWQIHKGATGLLWLENHPKVGTLKARKKAVNRSYAMLMSGLKSIGFYGGAVCIHGYEGSWSSATGNGYYGGMQMDYTFQSHYGKPYLRTWGTANRWPVWAQLHASYRAWASGRGWWPWPNTARACGLL